MKDKKPGQIFFSKVTGCRLIVVPKEVQRCNFCAYRLCNYSKKFRESLPTNIGCLSGLRLDEAGQCWKTVREDKCAVYFQIVEVLYEIPEETKELILDLSKLYRDPKDRLNARKLLLELEYEKYYGTRRVDYLS